MKNKNYSKREAGVSLVELMISIAVSLFCLTVISAVYINIKKNFHSKDSLVSMTESQRNALVNMGNTIQLAGSYSWKGPHFNPFPEHEHFLQRQIISGGPSKISVRYRTSPNTNQQSCAGTGYTDAENTVFINTYELNEQGELTCTVNDSVKVVIASNIHQFNVLFGMDRNGDNSTDTYDDGTGMSPGDWLLVRSVQVSIVFSSQQTSAGSGAGTPPPLVQNIYLMNTHAL